MGGGKKVVIEPHRHEGVFIARGKEDALVTKNMVLGESVYGEKRIAVEEAEAAKIEYRVWNPFRSKLAAAILGGVDKIHMPPGSKVRNLLTLFQVVISLIKFLLFKVLYLGAASGTSVSHVSDVVGPEGSIQSRFINVSSIQCTKLMTQYLSFRNGLRCRVQSQIRKRLIKCGQEENQRGPHHRGRAAPAQVPDAGPHGGLCLLGRRPAGPGQDRGTQRPVFPQEWWTLCHLYQGKLY